MTLKNKSTYKKIHSNNLAIILTIIGLGIVATGVGAVYATVTYTESVYINNENSGFIADASNLKRVGLMKYFGHEAGIWRSSGQDFAIGRTDGSDITTSTPSVTDLYVDGSGNVGIGTTSPLSELVISADDANVGLHIINTNTANTEKPAEIVFDRTAISGESTQKAAVGMDSTSRDFFIWVNGQDRLNIDTNGNVGIGTTTPNSALQVSGYFQLDTSSGTPPSADCNASDEYGRMKVDSTALSIKLYVCTPNGWDTK